MEFSVPLPLRTLLHLHSINVHGGGFIAKGILCLASHLRMYDLLQTQHWSVFLHLIPMPNYRILMVEGAVEFFFLFFFFLLLFKGEVIIELIFCYTKTNSLD
jgi:hypothetical protein